MEKCDQLYKGIPCIWDGERYILFSPYAQKFAGLSYQDAKKDETMKNLKKSRFFGTPLDGASHEMAKLRLILTTDCNLRCKYCYVENSNKPAYMTPAFAVRAIKEVIKSSTKKIYLNFFGGEPTLNMLALKASVTYVNSLGIDTKYHIVTNGVISDRTLDYLIGNTFTFTVSTDGLPEVDNIQRPTKDGKDFSKRIEKTIRRLSKERTNFQTRMTITRFNVDRIEEAITYWASLGVKFVHFELVSVGKKSVPSEFSTPNIETYLKNVKRTLDKAEELGVYVINSAYMNLLIPSQYFCTIAGGEGHLFTPDGGISACYRVQSFNDSLQDYIVGKYNSKIDKFEIDTLKFRKFRNIKVDSFEECKNCFAKYICGSGCPYQNFVQTGSFQKVNKWMCNIKKELLHDAIVRMYKSSKNSKGSVFLGTSVFENLEI